MIITFFYIYQSVYNKGHTTETDLLAIESTVYRE